MKLQINKNINRGPQGGPLVKPSTGPRDSFPRDWSRISPGEMEALRANVDNAKKCVGQTFTTVAGSTINFAVKIPQIGKLFLGFAFAKEVTSGIVSVEINNVKFIDSVGSAYFVRNTSKDEFSPFPMPLGGLDQIKFTISSSASEVGTVAIYYI